MGAPLSSWINWYKYFIEQHVKGGKVIFITSAIGYFPSFVVFLFLQYHKFALMKNAPIRPYKKQNRKKRLFDEFLKLQNAKTLKKISRVCFINHILE